MPDVSLMGPNVALPPDIQAQQEQLQIQQMIAQSLLGQSAQPYSPVVHTGGGNPFARDVANWGGVISQIANSMGGRAMLAKIAPQQVGLAQQAEKIRQQDVAGVMQTLQGGPTQGPYEGGSIDKPPSVLGAVDLANKSAHPLVRQLGDTLLKAFIEGQSKGIPTGGEIFSGARNLTTPSMAASISPGLFGPRIDPSKLENKATEVSGPGGAVGTIAPLSGAQVKPAGVLQPPPQGITPAADNPTGADISHSPDGSVKVLETPGTKGGEDTAKQHIKTLEEGRDFAQAFVETQPKLLKALELIPKADLKIGGDYVTKARQWMINLGINKDDANKVGDTQTFLKTMMSPAVGAARAFNSRATQMEFVQFLKAFAASQDTDPRAATNIVTQMLLDGYNANMQHENNIKNFKSVPGVQNAESFRVKNFPSIESLVTKMDKAGAQVGVDQNPETGILTDHLATNRQMQPAPAAAGPTPAVTSAYRAYNPKTKETMQYNPEGGTWELVK